MTFLAAGFLAMTFLAAGFLAAGFLAMTFLAAAIAFSISDFFCTIENPKLLNLSEARFYTFSTLMKTLLSELLSNKCILH